MRRFQISDMQIKYRCANFGCADMQIKRHYQYHEYTNPKNISKY